MNTNMARKKIENLNQNTNECMQVYPKFVKLLPRIKNYFYSLEFSK